MFEYLGFDGEFWDFKNEWYILWVVWYVIGKLFKLIFNLASQAAKKEMYTIEFQSAWFFFHIFNRKTRNKFCFFRQTRDKLGMEETDKNNQGGINVFFY